MVKPFPTPWLTNFRKKSMAIVFQNRRLYMRLPVFYSIWHIQPGTFLSYASRPPCHQHEKNCCVFSYFSRARCTNLFDVTRCTCLVGYGLLPLNLNTKLKCSTLHKTVIRSTETRIVAHVDVVYYFILAISIFVGIPCGNRANILNLS